MESEGRGTNPSSIDSVVESTGLDLVHNAEPSASIKGFDNSDSKTIFDVNSDLVGSITTQGPIDDGGATPEDDINIYEGEDLNSYKEAATDPRWVDAMNSGMEALNRNKTWIIDLPSGRKLLGNDF
ncbi:hypothetical protein Tco_1417946 [Tanacetum coccineum]